MNLVKANRQKKPNKKKNLKKLWDAFDNESMDTKN